MVSVGQCAPIQLLHFTSPMIMMIHYLFSVSTWSILRDCPQGRPDRQTALAYYGCILNCKGFYCSFNEIRGVASVVNKASLGAGTSMLHQGRCNTHRAMCTNIAYLRCLIIEALCPLFHIHVCIIYVAPLPHPSHISYMCSCANEIIATNNANTT